MSSSASMSAIAPTSVSTSTSSHGGTTGSTPKSQIGGSGLASSGGLSRTTSSGGTSSSGKEYPKTGESLESSLQLSFVGLASVLAAIALMKKKDEEQKD